MGECDLVFVDYDNIEVGVFYVCCEDVFIVELIGYCGFGYDGFGWFR